MPLSVKDQIRKLTYVIE